MKNHIHNFWHEKAKPRLIKFLLTITKRDYIYFSLAIVVSVVMVLIWIRLFGADKDQITNVIDFSTISALVIEGAFVGLITFLRTKLQGVTEDPNKLTVDYDKLVERYSNEPNLVWTLNPNTKGEMELVVIPVVHVAWLFDKKIKIIDNPNNEYVLPEIIDRYYEELFSTHKTSKIYNSTNIRVNGWHISDRNEFEITTGRTSYYNSLVTNRSIDYEIKDGISVRELLECGPMVHPLENSKLSNHLGFNGFVESSDHKIFFVFRNNDVSIGKRTWGNSVGASLKAKYGLNQDFEFTEKGLKNAIFHEIEDEMGIPSSTLIKPDNSLVDNQDELYPIQFIAAYRDMLEGGKPQLLFHVKTTQTSEEIINEFTLINKNNKGKHKKYNHQANENALGTDGDNILSMNISELHNCRIYSNCIYYKNNFMPMLPSTSACVALFTLYLKMDRRPDVDYCKNTTETSVIGKLPDQELCEDAVFNGTRFVAVIDGATSKDFDKKDGKKPGKIAAELLFHKFELLDNMKTKYTDTPLQVLEELDKSIAIFKKNNRHYSDMHISASVVYFDRLKKIVVSYGDCKFKIGSACSDNRPKLIDRELSAKRAEIINKAINEGKLSIEEIRQKDIGRLAITNDLKQQYKYENKNDCEYGYPAINGNGINKDFIILHVVHEEDHVVLCSDGYPVIKESRKKSDELVENLIHEDPLIIGNNRYNFCSTKGCQIGANSFDDRTWVEIK